MIKVVTLESLLNENDKFRTDAFDFENAMIEIVEESMNIDELMCETNTRIAAHTVAEEGFVTLEANGLKSAIKTVFSKIIGFLKKAVEFIITIFRTIFYGIRNKLQAKKYAKDVRKWINIANSKKRIKSKATTFAKKFEDEVKKFKEQTKNDVDILETSGHEIVVLENEFIEACKNNNVNPEDLEASINKLKFESVKRMEKIEKYCENKSKYENLSIPVNELSAKDGDIGEISLAILRQLQEYESQKGDFQKLENESKKILRTLEKLGSEVQRIKDEGQLNSEYASTVNKTLNIIRSNITAIARRGTDISKWFRTANDIINGIELIGEALNYYVDTSRQFDEINGIPIYIAPDYIANQMGGAGTMPIVPGIKDPSEYKLKIDSSRTEKVLDDISTAKDVYELIFDNNEKVNVIVVSEEISRWKTDKPSWYNFIIGHEVGHIMNRDMARHNGEISTVLNNTTSKYSGTEAMADRVGMNISGISESDKKEIVKRLYKNVEKLTMSPESIAENGLENCKAFLLNATMTLKVRFSIASI